MNVEIHTKKDALIRALAAARACDSRGSLPALKHVLVEAGEDGVRFTGTDLYLGISTDLYGECDARGVFTADGSKLVAAARALPAGDVTLSFDGKTSLELRAGKARFRLSATNAVDFPPVPRPSAEDRRATIASEALLAMINATRHAAGTDGTRPHLSGLFFEYRKGRQVTAATDGHRLATSSQECAEGFDALIYYRSVDELRSLLSGHSGEVEVSCSESTVWFRCGDFELSSKLTKEQFPPYSKVIPATSSHRITVSRELLADAVRRVGALASDKAGAVMLTFDGGAIVVSVRDENGANEASDEVVCDFDGSARIYLSRAYLTDALNAWSTDDVVLGVSGVLDPLTVRPVNGSKDDIAVVMPINPGS